MSELSLLDVQACRVQKIDGISNLQNLSSLHLSHNQIKVIENIDKNTALDTIDLSGNPIEKLAGKVQGLIFRFQKNN